MPLQSKDGLRMTIHRPFQREDKQLALRQRILDRPFDKEDKQPRLRQRILDNRKCNK